MEHYRYDLFCSQKPEGKALYQDFNKVGEDITQRLLKLWYERCRLKTSLNFLQYRFTADNAIQDDMEDSWETRVNMMHKTLKIARKILIDKDNYPPKMTKLALGGKGETTFLTQCEANTDSLDALTIVLSIDKKTKISKLSEVGLLDPFQLKKSLRLAEASLKKIEIACYPVVYFNPRTVFLPDRKLCRLMKKALIKFKNDKDQQILMKFGLVEDHQAFDYLFKYDL